MNIAVQTIASRPLFVDFEMYTDGDDAFKQEISVLMINNLEEFQHALNVYAEQKNVTEFKKITHKIASTLTMLNDAELVEAIDKVKDTTLSADHMQATIKLLHTICDGIITSLEKESKLK